MKKYYIWPKPIILKKYLILEELSDLLIFTMKALTASVQPMDESAVALQFYVLNEYQLAPSSAEVGIAQRKNRAHEEEVGRVFKCIPEERVGRVAS